MKLHYCAFTTMAALLAMQAVSQGSLAISVNNAGFEAPVPSNDGAWIASATGWANVNNAEEIGVLNPGSADFTAQAPEGTNVGYIYGGAVNSGLGQVLTATLQAGASYSLSVKVGNSKSNAYDGYRAQLLAGGTVLAEDNNSLFPAVDSFVTATVSYSYNAGLHAALLGQPLEIRLLGVRQSGTSGGQTEFDDVKLTVALADPTAIPGGPYTVAFGGSLSLDGSASQPSNGQLLTTYEWDLDNDGTFTEAVSGAMPTAINYATLTAAPPAGYGMVIGANTIKLRVTDNSSPTPKTAIADGTVTLKGPIASQYGILDLDANGGINPNTNLPWKAGDNYRLAFHTAGSRNTIPNDPEVYNDFVIEQARLNPALEKSFWAAMVTVNLNGGLTQASSPKRHVKDNTGTGDLTGGAGVGGAGVPVYAMDGKTCIARNNADIWDAWSNPFQATSPTLRAGTNVYYSPFLNQHGLQPVTPDVNHGVDVATGCNQNGNHVNALGNTTDVTTINRGSSNANTTDRVWNRFTDATTVNRSFYAISYPLTIVDLADSVNPNLLSFADDMDGANAILDLDPVVYTVTFDEGMDPFSVDPSDFVNGGTATVTIDSVKPTFESTAAFKVTVTPTSTGTIILRAKAGAVFEDFVGNAVDTTSAIADDTTITVIADTTPPTLVSIADSVSGEPILAFTGLTYTVTFDEGIDSTSVTPSDFGNGGTAPITVNSVTLTADPAVYTVSVTTAGPGTLNLEIVAGAEITDFVGNPLNTTTALPDDITITVNPDPLPTLVSITDRQDGEPVFATQAFTYLVTFSQAMNMASLDLTDFENGTGPAITVNNVAATSSPSVFAVHVTPGGAGTITLQIAAGAVITNLNGTALDTTSAIPDDTAITVNAGSGPARGIITVDGTTSASANAATVSATLDASGSDKLVVIVTGEHGFVGNLGGLSSSVTYDDISLTRVVNRNPIGGTPFDQTYNDIWYLDLAGVTTVSGSIIANVTTRGNVTAFALSGTAPGVGQTAISPQASKSVVLSTGFANSLVIASHGMGGDGNTANVNVVDTVAPLIETSARFNGSNWDGHVTGYALISSAGTATYAFTGGNLVGSHTIAAEFPAATVPSGPGYGAWVSGPFAGALTNPSASLDFDGGGLATGIEWVVGGDPTLASDDAGKAPAFNNSDPNNFVFTYRRRDAAAADPKTAIAVEYGTSFSGWITAGNGVAGVTINDTVVPEPGFRTVVVSIPKALAGPEGKLFARLNVVISP